MIEPGERITQWVLEDPLRIRALDCAAQLNLPQGYLAAGFVRNLVWDQLHNFSEPTPLNDVDLIYFDPEETESDQQYSYEAQLQAMMPDLRWQVRNQALMHKRNGDRPYTGCVDAMGFWPEKETAVAIRKTGEGSYECFSAFGFDSLFRLEVSHNPARPLRVFQQRIIHKDWRAIWPRLAVVSPE